MLTSLITQSRVRVGAFVHFRTFIVCSSFSFAPWSHRASCSAAQHNFISIVVVSHKILSFSHYLKILLQFDMHLPIFISFFHFISLILLLTYDDDEVLDLVSKRSSNLRIAISVERQLQFVLHCRYLHVRAWRLFNQRAAFHRRQISAFLASEWNQNTNLKLTPWKWLPRCHGLRKSTLNGSAK